MFKTNIAVAAATAVLALSMFLTWITHPSFGAFSFATMMSDLIRPGTGPHFAIPGGVVIAVGIGLVAIGQMISGFKLPSILAIIAGAAPIAGLIIGSGALVRGMNFRGVGEFFAIVDISQLGVGLFLFLLTSLGLTVFGLVSAFSADGSKAATIATE